jgi:hypothetical protein
MENTQPMKQLYERNCSGYDLYRCSEIIVSTSSLKFRCEFCAKQREMELAFKLRMERKEARKQEKWEKKLLEIGGSIVERMRARRNFLKNKTKNLDD